MHGTINITITDHKDGPVVATEVDLHHISFQDKTFLINDFLKCLRIPPSEAALHLLAIRSGLVNSSEHKEETP